MPVSSVITATNRPSRARTRRGRHQLLRQFLNKRELLRVVELGPARILKVLGLGPALTIQQHHVCHLDLRAKPNHLANALKAVANHFIDEHFLMRCVGGAAHRLHRILSLISCAATASSSSSPLGLHIH